VILQFRWMPQTKKRFGQKMDIRSTGPGNDWEELIAEINTFQESGNMPPVGDGIIHAKAMLGTLPSSGQIFHVQMEEEDAFKFKDMVDVQWACILVAALCGAAGSPELLSNNDPDDSVMQWLQGQARCTGKEGVELTESLEARHCKKQTR
ncbi:hypothetical protein FSARC_15055, partial [Fusarium sarcochroum]